MLVPLSLLSAACRWRWLVLLRNVRLTAWLALACVLFALFFAGWPQRIDRWLELRAALGAQTESIETDAPPGR